MKRRELLERVAHHEAGHAVVAWRLGVGFKSITVAPGADSLGHVLMRPIRFTRANAENRIITDFAGQISEGRHLNKNPRYGMHSDNQNAVDLAYQMFNTRVTVEAYLRFCFSVSRDIVESNWNAIRNVASVLTNRITLSHPEFLEVISPGSAELVATLRRIKAQ